MYHDNPAINDTVLTIINDGNGSQCGMTYKQRCEASDTGIMAYRLACKTYSEQRVASGARALTKTEIIEAANYLQAYYRQHMKEMSA